jgi:CheY-like chemotaxis protein
MAKLLLADSDEARAARLAAALAPAGHEVTVARSGSYALTMLERGRPDLILTRLRIDDMDAAELAAVVRGDPATRTIPMVVLDADAGADLPDVDLVLNGATPMAVVLMGIENVLGMHRQSPRTTADSRAAVPTGLRGSLAVMDLPEVSQAIALGTKTGRLSLALTSGRGVVVFEAGRIVHAEYAGLTGSKAFAGLVRAARLGGDFSFTAADRDEIRAIARTIHGSVDRLLLTVASDIDEAPVAATSPHAEGN